MKKKQFNILLGAIVVFSAMINSDLKADDRPSPRPTVAPIHFEVQPIKMRYSLGGSNLLNRVDGVASENPETLVTYTSDGGKRVFDLCEKEVRTPADMAILCECIANQSHDLEESVQIESNICRSNIEQAMPFYLSGQSFEIDLDAIFRPDSHYHNIEPQEASRICQQAVDKGLLSDYGKTIESYMNTAVIGEFLKMAGQTGVNCSADGMKNRFKSNFGDVDGSGKRQCSAQSVAYIIGQLEKESTNCTQEEGKNYECAFDANLASQMKISDSSTFNQRQSELERMLEATRGLAPLPSGATSPDQARVELRSQYENFISNSRIGDDLAKVIAKRVELGLVNAGGYTRNGAEASIEGLGASVSNLPNKNKVLLKAIIGFVAGNSDMSQEKKDELLAKMRIVGAPDPIRLISGEADISEEQAALIMAELNNDVSNSCSEAVDKIVDDCKLLTPGALYDNRAKSAVVCRDNSDANPLRENSLIVSAMDYSTWRLLIAQQPTLRGKAAVQQLMCLQHYDQTNGLKLSGQNNMCSERNVSGRSRTLSANFDEPDQLRTLFLTSDGSSSGEIGRTQDVARSFASCSPFAAPSGVSNTLMDEAAPFSENFETMAAQVNDSERRNIQSATNSLVEVTSSMGDSSARASYIRSARRSGSTLGSNAGSNDRNASSVSGSGGSSRSVSERVRSQIQVPVQDRAASFYSDMGARELEQMASSFNSTAAANIPTISETEPTTIDSARQQLEAVSEARSQNDALLAQLEELRRQNEELFSQLKAKNISEIEKADGSVVKIEDAFAETNRQIEAQKARALAEREELDRKTEQAQRVVEQSRSGNSRSIASQAGSSFGAGISPTPSSSVSAGATISSSGGSSSNSISPSSGASGGSTASGSQIQAYGPPAPYQGIVLSSEELSIAKPRLDLGGRSLVDSSELVKVAISTVKNELAQRNATLPAYNLNGKQITEYILQEQDGKTVLVYLDGDVVKVEPIDLELEATQVVVEAPEEVEEAPEVIAEPVRAPAAIESQGRKKWSEVEELLQSANE